MGSSEFRVASNEFRVSDCRDNSLLVTRYSILLAEDAPDAIQRHVPFGRNLREKEVQDNDGDETVDEALGARLADPAGAGAAGESFVAGNQGDGGAEEDGLDDAFEDLPVVDAAGGELPVGAFGNSEGFDGDQPAADDPEEVAVDGQQGREQHAGDEARHDQNADGVGAHDAHGVELFGDVHGAQLGGERAADASGEHDGGQHRANLLDHGDVDDAAEAVFLADGLELRVAFDGQHHADERPGDAYNGDGHGADFIHLREDLAEVLRAHPRGSHAAEGAGDEDAEVAEDGQRMGGPAADLFDEPDGHGSIIPRRPGMSAPGALRAWNIVVGAVGGGPVPNYAVGLQLMSQYPAMDFACHRCMSAPRGHSGGTVLEGYTYLGLETIVTRAHPQTGSAAKTTYTWGLGYIDDLVERTDSSGTRLYAQQDAGFNVTALISTAGTVVERFAYDPYGAATVLTSGWSATTDSCNWAFRWKGGRYDSGNGLYNFRNRDYSPTLGRWMQNDPAGYVDGANLYQAVLGAPIDNVDPLGLADVPASWSSSSTGSGSEQSSTNSSAGQTYTPALIRPPSALPSPSTAACHGGLDRELFRHKSGYRLGHLPPGWPYATTPPESGSGQQDTDNKDGIDPEKISSDMTILELLGELAENKGYAKRAKLVGNMVDALKMGKKIGEAPPDQREKVITEEVLNKLAGMAAAAAAGAAVGGGPLGAVVGAAAEAVVGDNASGVLERGLEHVATPPQVQESMRRHGIEMTGYPGIDMGRIYLELERLQNGGDPDVPPTVAPSPW